MAPWKTAFLYQLVVFWVHDSLQGSIQDAFGRFQSSKFNIYKAKLLGQYL